VFYPLYNPLKLYVDIKASIVIQRDTHIKFLNLLSLHSPCVCSPSKVTVTIWWLYGCQILPAAREMQRDTLPDDTPNTCQRSIWKPVVLIKTTFNQKQIKENDIK